MLPILLLTLSSLWSQSFYENGEEVVLIPLPQPRSVSQIRDSATATWYLRSSGTKVGVRNDLIISWSNVEAKEEVLATLPYTSRRTLSKTITLLTFPWDTDLFELSKQLYHNPNINACHPNFQKEKQLR